MFSPPFRLYYITHSRINQGVALYIIRNLLRYIINAKHCISSSRRQDARWRVMRYSPKGADDIHRTSRGDDIPSLREPPKLGKLASGNPYGGLDKQKQNMCR